jgi:hypothetical protein
VQEMRMGSSALAVRCSVKPLQAAAVKSGGGESRTAGGAGGRHGGCAFEPVWGSRQPDPTPGRRRCWTGPRAYLRRTRARRMAENREVFGTVAQPGPVLILVHHDIEPPVQLVFDTPVGSDDLIQSFGREGCAEQVIGHFGCGLGGGFAHAFEQEHDN